MSPQVLVGLVLVLVGLGVKVAAAVLKLPEIALVGEVTNLGMLLLGKEMLQPSAAMQQKRASIAPKAGIVFAVLLLAGCASAPPVRDTANEFTKRVNQGAEALDAAAPMVRVSCAFIADRSPCPAVKQAHATASASIDAAHRLIGIYDATGQGVLETVSAVIAAEADAAAFALEVAKLAEVIRAEAHRIESSGRAPVGDPEAGGQQAADAGTEGGAATPQAAVSAP